MKYFHNITVSVFIKPEEDYSLIKEKFLSLFPFHLEDNKINIAETDASTFNDRTIRIITVKIMKESLINILVKDIMSKIPEENRNMLLSQAETRVDKQSFFYFRLSKKRLIEEGRYLIVDHGNCFHFRCSVASYPNNQERAIGAVRKMIESYL